MRKLFSIVLGCAIVLLSACSTSSLAYYDDVYTTSSDAQYGASTPTQTKSGPAELQPDSIVYEYDENGNLLDTKTYYPGQTTPTVTYYEVPVEESSYAVTDYDDDCYDYYYTSRLRRFHTNLYCNYGYYDPYFDIGVGIKRIFRSCLCQQTVRFIKIMGVDGCFCLFA